MKIIELNIPVSGTWHRDSELLAIGGKLPDLELVIKKDSDSSRWHVRFTDATAYKVTSEEFSTTGFLASLPLEGGFFEAIESPWMGELSQGGSDQLAGSHHFIYCCYDEVIEIIAKDFSCTAQ